jgi:CheY-like chemotaxis protein
MSNTAIKKILLVDDSAVSRRILKSCIPRSELKKMLAAGALMGIKKPPTRENIQEALIKAQEVIG